MARIRRASGVREHDLLARAKALSESVEPLLPRRTADCPPERFERLREELEAVRAFRDDAKRLERLARWGDPLARSYAGLLRYALDPTTPLVATFPIPGGEASFAALARTDREAEVAVQQSDDPARLLLGYLTWTRKGYAFFAARKALWCTGRSSEPPPDFLAEHLAELPYKLAEGSVQGRYLCPHLASGEARPYLEVGWRGAGRTFAVCRRCAKDDRHLLAGLSEGAAVPDPSSEFPVSAHLNVTCSRGAACVHGSLPELPRSLVKAYELGRLSDAALIDRYVDELRPRIERAAGPLFVAGGICYGDRLEAFLDALHPSPVERRALASVLAQERGPFEVDEPSASRALEKLWGEHAEEILRSIVRDPAEARRLVDEARGAPGRVAEILKRAQRRSDDQELLDALPRYDRLSREAAWADRVARAFRTGGASVAERTVVQGLPSEGKERGLAYGFLLALDRAQPHAWQFSGTEKEFGVSLAPRARELLEAPASGYHTALEALLRTAGVVDWGSPTAAGAAPSP